MSSLSKRSQAVAANMLSQMPEKRLLQVQATLARTKAGKSLGSQTFDEAVITWDASRTEVPELANVPHALPQPLSKPILILLPQPVFP